MNEKPLERLRLSQTARPVDTLYYWAKDNQLNLSPPYQRGDVWGVKRQRNLIRSILLGVPIPSIIINDRFASSWNTDGSTFGMDGINCIAVIDGKQRITAILAFLNNKLDVPAQWFGFEGNLEAFVHFSDLPTPKQRGFRQTPIQMSEGQLPSIEAEREVFELVNFGGLAQGESDLLNPPAINSRWKNTPWSTNREQVVTVTRTDSRWVWYESELGKGFAAAAYFVEFFKAVDVKEGAKL